ncbi:MAG TPA: ATP-binding protein [Acidimicrobiales bacterium]|nr:ATP-binding protein [Acidimicrobiales bacterium]
MRVGSMSFGAQELPFVPTSAATARRLVARCADSVGLGDLTHVAVLLTSELVANALRHGRPPMVLACEGTGAGLRVSVSDGLAALPSLRRHGGLDEGGRGLAMVDVLANQWGSDLAPGGGKCVWFDLERSQL